MLKVQEHLKAQEHQIKKWNRERHQPEVMKNHIQIIKNRP